MDLVLRSCGVEADVKPCACGARVPETHAATVDTRDDQRSLYYTC